MVYSTDLGLRTQDSGLGTHDLGLTTTNSKGHVPD